MKRFLVFTTISSILLTTLALPAAAQTSVNLDDVQSRFQDMEMPSMPQSGMSSGTDWSKQFESMQESQKEFFNSQSNWKDNFNSTGEQANANFGEKLMSNCFAAQMAGRSGNSELAQSLGCEPCADTQASDSYKQLFNPQSGNLFGDPTDGNISETEWNRLPKLVQKKILEQNPQLNKEFQKQATQKAEAAQAEADCQKAGGN